MTLLIIAAIVYSLLSIRHSVKYTQFIIDEDNSGALVSIVGLIFFTVALCLFMASIGHGIVALIILIPSIVSFLVGVVVGIVES